MLAHNLQVGMTWWLLIDLFWLIIVLMLTTRLLARQTQQKLLSVVCTTHIPTRMQESFRCIYLFTTFRYIRKLVRVHVCFCCELERTSTHFFAVSLSATLRNCFQGETCLLSLYFVSIMIMVMRIVTMPYIMYLHFI